MNYYERIHSNDALIKKVHDDMKLEGHECKITVPTEPRVFSLLIATKFLERLQSILDKDEVYKTIKENSMNDPVFSAARMYIDDSISNSLMLIPSVVGKQITNLSDLVTSDELEGHALLMFFKILISTKNLYESRKNEQSKLKFVHETLWEAMKNGKPTDKICESIVKILEEISKDSKSFSVVNETGE